MTKAAKRIAKEDCKEKHEEMAKMGMYYCPVCDAEIKEQAPIIMTIQKQARVVYRAPEAAK
jgi:hypothetical protein